jgi:hypothetical protein
LFFIITINRKIIMAETIEFIKDRATKTISAAKQVATFWTWQELTIDEIQTALTAITGNSSATPPVVGQEEIASQAEQAMLAARGAWDAQLDELHRRTVQGVSMAKNRNRNNPANLAVLAGLTARGTSRAETLAEALAWESAWANIDPAWSPLPANTLAAFGVLRKLCAEDLQQGYMDEQADYRQAAEKLADMAAALEQTVEAWYADATAVFPVGTPQGDMIRSTVPTTYTPPTAKPATNPTPAPAAIRASVSP